MRLWMVFIAAGVFACADGRPGSGDTPQAALLKASQNADQVADQNQNTEQNTEQNTNQAVNQNAGQDTAKAAELDVLVVTRHYYHGDLRTRTDNWANEQKAHADKIASMLAMLPPKIAAYDYKIAIAGHTSSNCIQAFVTKSSQPDPGAALASAFWRIDKGNVIPHGHLTRWSVNSSSYFRAFQNVMAALTDIAYTGVRSSPMPTADQTTYFQLPDGTIEQRDSEGNPSEHYRQLAGGLVVTDYYDIYGSATCARPWLREDALLAIVIIDTQKGQHPCVNWQFCTMPDVEQALRDAGKLQNKGLLPQDRSYRLYALASYREVSSYPSRRKDDNSIPTNMRVDWQDFKDYTISNSSAYLAYYLGNADEDDDYVHVFDDIVAAAAVPP